MKKNEKRFAEFKKVRIFAARFGRSGKFIDNSSLTILRDYNEVKCKNNISRSKIRLIQFHKES